MPILEVKNLTKKFGTFIAVHDISFSLQQGEILGLLGRNGAGKTTTIQLLLGLMDATHGEIQYFGKIFHKHREEILQQVNFSSTYISMPWFFTVMEIMELYARLYEIPDKKKRITKLLREFEMDHLVKKQFYMLSAGEKTRLLIAKAFLNYPKIILLDEPTASLDPDIAIKIRAFLMKEKKEYNVSILLTSHNMAEVEEMCDRVMIIQSGKIIAKDTPANLAKKITTCFLHLLITRDTSKAKAFFATQHILYKEKHSLFTFSLKEKQIAQFLMTLAKEYITYDEIFIDKPDLEDYFLEVVNKNIC